MKTSKKSIFFKKSKPKEGYEILVSNENSYLKDLLVGRLRLGHKGAHYKGETKDEELLIEPLIGTCDVIIEKDEHIQKFREVGRRTSRRGIEIILQISYSTPGGESVFNYDELMKI